MIDKDRLAMYAVTQLSSIAAHGCSGIKCKKCVINNVCSRDASKSRDIARELLFYARNKSADAPR